MSQVSIIDIEGNHPQIPVRFNANAGFAIPIANMLEIYGDTTVAGSLPVHTVGSGNNITTYVQISQAIAATDATKIGLSNFNSSHFSVDANGFVSLLGGGEGIDSIGVQTGTNPIVPTVAGLVTINGSVVAAGTNPLRSNGTSPNTMALEVQISQALATTDATKIGLANFNSAHFSVDANGFVSLTGGGQAIDSFTTDISGPVAPNGAGNVAFTGATNIFSDGSVANTMRLNLQGTNHALFVGRGSNTASTSLATGNSGQVLQSAGASADPAFSTATYPSTATGTGTILRADGTNWLATTSTYPNTNAINTLLYASSANVMSALATTNRASLSTNSTGVPTWLALTDGQLVIGSTAGSPAAANITSTGTTVTVTNGSNSINLEVNSGGFTWTDVTSATQTLAVQNGYVTDRAGGVTYTLPATAALGNIIKIVGKLGLGVITPNANQQILIGSTSGLAGVTGTATSTNAGDCIELVCITAGTSTVWRADSVIGTWTVVTS